MTLRIVTIDDEVGTTDMLVVFLKSEGFDVVGVNSGVEGVKLIRETEPDIIITDLVMPEMDGLQVCAEVRKFSNAPILVLSALDGSEVVSSALDAGADEILCKPVPGSVLLAHLNKLTRRSKYNGKSPSMIKMEVTAT